MAGKISPEAAKAELKRRGYDVDGDAAPESQYERDQRQSSWEAKQRGAARIGAFAGDAVTDISDVIATLFGRGPAARRMLAAPSLQAPTARSIDHGLSGISRAIGDVGEAVTEHPYASAQTGANLAGGAVGAAGDMIAEPFVDERAADDLLRAHPGDPAAMRKAGDLGLNAELGFLNDAVLGVDAAAQGPGLVRAAAKALPKLSRDAAPILRAADESHAFDPWLDHRGQAAGGGQMIDYHYPNGGMLAVNQTPDEWIITGSTIPHKGSPQLHEDLIQRALAAGVSKIRSTEDTSANGVFESLLRRGHGVRVAPGANFEIDLTRVQRAPRSEMPGKGRFATTQEVPVGTSGLGIDPFSEWIEGGPNASVPSRRDILPELIKRQRDKDAALTEIAKTSQGRFQLPTVESLITEGRTDANKLAKTLDRYLGVDSARLDPVRVGANQPSLAGFGPRPKFGKPAPKSAVDAASRDQEILNSIVTTDVRDGRHNIIFKTPEEAEAFAARQNIQDIRMVTTDFKSGGVRVEFKKFEDYPEDERSEINFDEHGVGTASGKVQPAMKKPSGDYSMAGFGPQRKSYKRTLDEVAAELAANGDPAAARFSGRAKFIEEQQVARAAQEPIGDHSPWQWATRPNAPKSNVQFSHPALTADQNYIIQRGKSGYTHQQIADEMQTGENVIRTQLSLARTRLNGIEAGLGDRLAPKVQVLGPRADSVRLPDIVKAVESFRGSRGAYPAIEERMGISRNTIAVRYGRYRNVSKKLAEVAAREGVKPEQIADIVATEMKLPASEVRRIDATNAEMGKKAYFSNAGVNPEDLHPIEGGKWSASDWATYLLGNGGLATLGGGLVGIGSQVIAPPEARAEDTQEQALRPGEKRFSGYTRAQERAMDRYTGHRPARSDPGAPPRTQWSGGAPEILDSILNAPRHKFTKAEIAGAPEKSAQYRPETRSQVVKGTELYPDDRQSDSPKLTPLVFGMLASMLGGRIGRTAGSRVGKEILGEYLGSTSLGTSTTLGAALADDPKHALTDTELMAIVAPGRVAVSQSAKALARATKNLTHDPFPTQGAAYRQSVHIPGVGRVPDPDIYQPKAYPRPDKVGAVKPASKRDRWTKSDEQLAIDRKIAEARAAGVPYTGRFVAIPSVVRRPSVGGPKTGFRPESGGAAPAVRDPMDVTKGEPAIPMRDWPQRETQSPGWGNGPKGEPSPSEPQPDRPRNKGAGWGGDSTSSKEGSGGWAVGMSAPQLEQRAKDLGMKVPEGASRSALIQAIEIAERIRRVERRF